MIRYFLRAFAAHFRSGKTLFLLTLVGVALGVASVLAIQILNGSSLAAFEGSLRAVSGEADLSVVARAGGLDEGVLPRVLAEPDVAAAWPVCRIDAALSGSGGVFLELVGVDLFAPVRVPLRERRADVSQALSVPGWVAVTPALAGDMGWSIGDSFEVSSGTRRASLIVGALVDFQKLTPLASRRLAVMDISQLQGLLGIPGVIQQVDVRARDGVAARDLAARLAQRVGSHVEVVTPEQRRQQAADLLGAFRLNLTALSFISLFVGGFLVFSSTQASLVRRRAELGLLRSTGATRGQILALMLAEVVVVGLLGVAVGIPLGYVAARSNLGLVSATVSNIYLLEEIERLSVPVWLFALAFVLGVAGALSGALFPALDVSRRDTRSLLAPFDLHERIGRAAPRLFAVGIAILGIALSLHLFVGQWRPGGFGLGVAVLLAIPLVSPLVVFEIGRRIPVRDFGLGYALKSLGLRLQTTAIAVGALAVAVSMLFGVTFLVGSFRRTLEIWVDSTVRADVYVTSESWSRGRSQAVLDPAVEAALLRWPGARAVDRLRMIPVAAAGRRVTLSGVDLGLPGGAGRLALLDGDPETAYRAARDDGDVLIGEPLARRAGVGPGGILRVQGPDGEISFRVSGVYFDYGNESGSMVADLKTIESRFGPGPVNNVALYLDPGLDPERVVDDLKARFSGIPLVFRSNARLRREIFAIFDQTFAITRLLQGMSLVIAVCGIALTLIVLAREGVSELALYRAIGATRGQLFRVYLGKGLGMAGIGLVLGAAGGLALAMILIFVINRAYFGWTIAVHWPIGALAREAFAIFGAAALASLYPALRASRTPATELSRDDL